MWVGGEHDIATRVSLAFAVARAAQLDDVPLVVDLSAVTFMDASTVGAIVRSHNRLRSRAQSLEVRAPSPPALRVLELCGLTHLIRDEPLHSIGAAAALSTWVDVPPIEPARGADGAAAPVPVRPKTRQPARARTSVHVQIEEAATPSDVNRAGP